MIKMKKVYQFEIRGEVQGVGFRYSTKEFAQSKHMLGTVKNNPDGTVEVMLWGNESEKKTLEEFFKNNLGWSHVDLVHVESITDERLANEMQKLDSFEIIR